ncbi:MAG: B12-binding domain-containing radical SAM protein [Deltaproteobacteria bacterium]|nr:B12-binding domain-containing radical SAM protein [Deltaproteobacteria bacterium]
MSLKILLIAPPIQDYYDTEIRHFPLGLLYLKSAINHFHPDVEVKIMDFHHGRGKRSIPVPRELNYTKRYFGKNDLSPFSSFYHYYHFGKDFDSIVDDIVRLNPDLVGITSMFTPYYFEVQEIASRIKRQNPNIKIVLGGAHASIMSVEKLKDGCADYVVIGEGEQAIVELVSHLKGDMVIGDVSSLAYKDNNQIIVNPIKNYQIETIPSPLAEDFAYSTYRVKEKPMCMILTSRGCPYQCSFCTTHRVFGRGYRQREVDSIIEEMNAYYQKGVRFFDFEDDNLTLNKGFIIELCSKIEEIFKADKPTLTAMNGVSYWHLDQDILNAMKKAGFVSVNLSLVSRDRNSDLLRPMDMERFKEIAWLAYEMGFDMTGYYILGLPGQTIEQMIDSLELLASLPLTVGASPFYLLPGSTLAEGITFDRERMIKARLTALGGNAQDIYTLFILSRIINFIKTLPVTRDMDISEVLSMPSKGREGIGKIILEKFFRDGELCMNLSGNRYEPNKGINPYILRHLGTTIKKNVTKNGHTVRIDQSIIFSV